MEKKFMSWKTKGMNQDLSVSAFNPEFSFENRNLRLSTNENNTQLSWVNERGTKKMTISSMKDRSGDQIVDGNDVADNTIHGYPIGTAVINHRLILFTTNLSDHKDYIYSFTTEGNYLNGIQLYSGNLNFDTEHPIETLVSYESDTIQKVYWVDGKNQPRVINIVSDKDWADTSFDFVTVFNGGSISVDKVIGGGLFNAGVIQYCFTYFNKYGQQSNVVDVSPLYYIAHIDRGASPEEPSVSNSFKITIANPDDNFDYVRIYSIQRTSLNLDPVVKIVEDIKIDSSTIVYTDSGTVGIAIDPYELLYVGGKEITAYTLTEKDKTLFLGNITEKSSPVDDIQSYFRDVIANREDDLVQFYRNSTIKKLELESNTSFYSNTFTLNHNQQEITTFKGGDKYRFGFQLQKNTGEWTEPIWVGDYTNEFYPEAEIDGITIRLPYASGTMPLNAMADFNPSDYQKIRPVIVFPSIVDRNVLCQGVVNPTVFNCKDRESNSPYAQASWFFRPYTGTGIDDAFNAFDEIINSVSITDSGGSAAEKDDDVSDDSSDYDTINILIAEVTNNNIRELLQRGYIISSTRRTFFQKKRHYFDRGVILLERIPATSNPDTPARCLYAFLSTDEWYAGSGSAQEEYTSDVNLYDIVSASNVTGKLYKYTVTMAPYIYYVKEENAPATANTYTFEFNEGTTLYSVEFNNYTQGNINYTGPDTGKYADWRHYKAIYNEVQGGMPTWEWPYQVDKYTSQSNTNSIFCCDQSIVTMHSPDIEFDTEVQSYSPDDLGLRIVGMVPIDASASAHHITASAMIETWHNTTNRPMFVRNPDFHVFGSGELQCQVLHKQGDVLAGRRLLSDYLWNDVVIKQDASKDDKIATKGLVDYLIYPWHRNGSLNSDTRTEDVASSWLKKKVESTILYSYKSEYFSSKIDYDSINTQFIFTENSQIANYRLGRQLSDSSSIEINYYPNIDKVLYNTEGYTVESNPSISEYIRYAGTDFADGTVEEYGLYSKSPVSIKYKSTSHAAIVFKQTLEDGNEAIPILPYLKTGENTSIGEFSYSGDYGYKPFWDSDDIEGHDYIFSQDYIEHTAPSTGCFLWLAELYKKNPEGNPFGGDSTIALRSNNWIVGGDEVPIGNGFPTLYWTVGDTYYQRYDCLKTYPFTKEDTNQVVEILSFMCETHTNLDGRYDRNRGQIDNTMMSPENFNLLNPVYNQTNNFFTYKKIESADEDTHSTSYPNYITYSKTKEVGADVDLWTNITLGSVLDLDGNRGEITSLQRFNDQILAFQDSGISQVLYNENVQISSQAGVPIEIANSGKVQGKRYISNTVGCSNKWSICQTPYGIYFIDSNEKSIYLFNGQLNNLSTAKGFNTWCKKNIPDNTTDWHPADTHGYATYYDRLNQDVLFVGRNEVLAYSEKIGNFTSFYDYTNAPYFCGLDDLELWIKPNYEDDVTEIYQHQAGEYCNFFGETRPYGTILVGNPEPQMDKTFTNIEFRACVDGDGEYEDGTSGTKAKYKPYLPFDYLQTWDEHQHGLARLSTKDGRSGMMHHIKDMTAALKRKFRIWRCDIPRDNLSSESTFDFSFDTSFRGIMLKRGLNRMRNPWIYLKLLKSEDTNKRTEIHDIVMTYFV